MDENILKDKNVQHKSMKRITFNLILLILESSLLGQINMSDSTFQVIGYWAMHEKQSYTVDSDVVDSVQLTHTAYAYIAKMSDALKTKLPRREEFPPVRNNIWTASRIHGSGWIIYSVETKEVSADNILNFEERIIEIQ